MTSRFQNLIGFVVFCAWLSPAHAEEIATPTLKLAIDLAGEGDHAGAAVEFRRLALESADRAQQGPYYWASAHEYFQCGRHETSDKMLNAAEDAGPHVKIPALLLRGENARASERWSEASFYYGTVLSGSASDEARALSARRLAEVHLRQHDVKAAREALRESPAPFDDGIAALDQYAAGHNKSPKVGGFLGLIPGLGYFYSGEVANGLRSIILNGLFIYGMVDTADEDQWGAFTVITFFEFTWYSGSIYGGIDAAHRYNRLRLDRAANAIDGHAGFAPDFKQLPELVLQFKF